MTALEVRPLHPVEAPAAAELLRRRSGAPVFLVPRADGSPERVCDLRPPRDVAGPGDPVAGLPAGISEPAAAADVARPPVALAHEVDGLHVVVVPGPTGPRAMMVVRHFPAEDAGAAGRPLHRVVALAADATAAGAGPRLVADVLARALADDGAEVRWTVTNDDLVLQRLLARSGFELDRARLGAVDDARRTWPGLPERSASGRVRRDEVEYVHREGASVAGGTTAPPALEIPSASGGTRWIRAAFAEDMDRLRTIVIEDLARRGLPPAPHDTDRDLEDPLDFFVAPGGVLDVVVEGIGDRALGSVGLRPLDDEGEAGTVELRKMYLDPAVRGEGIGGRLLAHALHRARGIGARRIVLQTHGTMTVARRLYEQVGFRPDPDAHLETDCDRAYVLDLDA